MKVKGFCEHKAEQAGKCVFIVSNIVIFVIELSVFPRICWPVFGHDSMISIIKSLLELLSQFWMYDQ